MAAACSNLGIITLESLDARIFENTLQLWLMVEQVSNYP